MQALQELILKCSQLSLLLLRDLQGGSREELVDINSRKPLAQDCGGRAIAAPARARAGQTKKPLHMGAKHPHSS